MAPMDGPIWLISEICTLHSFKRNISKVQPSEAHGLGGVRSISHARPPILYKYKSYPVGQRTQPGHLKKTHLMHCLQKSCFPQLRKERGTASCSTYQKSPVFRIWNGKRENRLRSSNPGGLQIPKSPNTCRFSFKQSGGDRVELSRM